MRYLKIVAEALRTISRAYLVVAGLLVAFAVVWAIFLAPAILKIPENFSYTANVISVDNFYDEVREDFKGEQYSKTEYRFDALSQNGRRLNIRNVFDVQSLDGKRIFHAEPVYTIDRYSRRLLADDIRDAEYILPPQGLRRGEGFMFRHVSSPIAAEMVYQGEESLYGLSVYKYKKINNAAVDQTEYMHFLPGVPEERGVMLASDLYLWVEPVTGHLVKVEDFSTDYYYFDSKTGERIAPYNQFLNTYSEETVQQHVSLAVAQKRVVSGVRYGMPVLLLMLAIVVLLVELRGVFPSSVRAVFRTYRLTILIAAISLCATVVAYYFTLSLYANDRTIYFSGRSTEIASMMERRMEKYVTMLLGTRGLFDASDQVDRDEWRLYIESLDLSRNFAGVQGVGFSKVMSPAEARKATEAIRDEGFSDFAIRPEGERDLYTAIVYIEPFGGLNLRAFGFDMYTEKVRRAAMDRARDTGNASMSGKVTLVQEDSANPQPGFLIYVPLYNDGKTASSSVPAPDALYGYVYSPFRMHELMASVLPQQPDDIRVRIYDGLKILPERLMYDSFAGQSTEEIDAMAYREIRTLSIAGHPWTIELTNAPGYTAPLLDRITPILVLLFGIMVGGLCSLLVYAAIRSKTFAVEYADKATRDLQESLGDLEQTKEAMLNVLEDVQEERVKVELVSNKLKIATESATIGVLEMDLARQTISADAVTATLYGREAKEFTESFDVWLQRVHPDDVAKLRASVMRAIEDRALFKETFRIIRPDGEERFITGYAKVELNEKKQPTKLVGVNLDVTKEHEVDRAKSEFVSLASHQLKTPVGAVKWDAEMLLAGDYGELAPKQKEVVEEIYGLNMRMSDLVTDFLNISRLELGTFAISPEVVRYAEVAEDVLVELKERIAEKGHTITKLYQDPMPETVADKKLLRVIFQNLISNAVKYTPDHGQVTVAISAEKDAVVIAVRNNGIVIPKKEQAKIFTKMFRASGAQTMDPDGNGLGLYLLKSIVETAGGSVSFESKEGADTVFTVSFPLPGMKKKEGTKTIT